MCECVSVCVSVCVYVCVCVLHMEVRGQLLGLGTTSTMWTMGIECGLSGVVVSNFTC